MSENVELSRRLALAFANIPPGSITLEERLALTEASEGATTFDELPDWVREVVETIEENMDDDPPPGSAPSRESVAGDDDEAAPSTEALAADDDQDGGPDARESAPPTAAESAAVTPQEETAVADTTTDTDPELADLLEAVKKLPPEFLANIAKKKAQAKDDADTDDADDADDDEDEDDDADGKKLPAFLKNKKKMTKESTVTDAVTESREQRIERIARERADAIVAERTEEAEIAARATELAEAAAAEETAVAARAAEIAAAAAAEVKAAELANETLEARVERLAQEKARTMVQQHVELNGPPARTGLTATPGTAGTATESTGTTGLSSDWPEKPLREYTEAERDAHVFPALEQHFMGSRSVFAS